MSIKEKLKDFISPDDDELYLDENEVETISKYEEPRSKTMANAHIDAKMVLFEPRSYEEAQEIAVRLVENKACVVNLHRLPHDFAQRTIDFLTGVIFALDGTIQKIGPNIILCAPKSIGVGGTIDLDGDKE